jgi:hypothetical protein
MPMVFTFLSLDLAGQHGQGRMETLKRLDAGHLIGTHHMRALGSEFRVASYTSHTLRIC